VGVATLPCALLTSSGKTGLSDELARRLQGDAVIISRDRCGPDPRAWDRMPSMPSPMARLSSWMGE
jgi:hypothetical protein